MAIDSASKRVAATGILQPGSPMIVYADGADTDDDRAAAAWGYGGIFAVAGVPGTGCKPPYMRIGGKKLWR